MGFGPQGFRNAPASKLLTYGTAAASLLTHYSRAHHRVGLTPRGLFARGELLSRWLTSQFAFTAPGEACVGLYLLYALRDVERVRGTKAHATRLLIAAVVSLGIQTLLCADTHLVRWLGLGGSSAGAFIQNFSAVGFAPGPHSLVAALLFPGFLATQPTTQTFTVAGVRFGDKVFTLLAGLRLFWSHGARSVVPALAGVCGSLVSEWAVTGRVGAVVTHRGGWTPPEWACASVRATLGRVLGVDVGGVGGGRRARGGRAAATVTRPRRMPRPRLDVRFGRLDDLAPAPPPPPGAVETLTSMGFDEHDARRALGMCGNDVEAATDALLADAR
ncbi:predicted protein [Micromonas commoda]|uniref:UBA domain-containing protein n=1 Tax=Micromonas commoda (strain RCC299 / NOUM17 / CCMP2709) TaxID=296587 RepID=C1ECZ1_MICCC|nr:predicted protein [Micromonas commoda]ACO65990.1 predicted protein [Micromonas commoda]|eukprot:XP_002504732.1 predicted protein [Micromonas commoda]